LDYVVTLPQHLHARGGHRDMALLALIAVDLGDRRVRAHAQVSPPSGGPHLRPRRLAVRLDGGELRLPPLEVAPEARLVARPPCSGIFRAAGGFPHRPAGELPLLPPA